jgi:hypothetical protein
VAFQYCLECEKKLSEHESRDGFCAACKRKSESETSTSYNDGYDFHYDGDGSEND